MIDSAYFKTRGAIYKYIAMFLGFVGIIFIYNQRRGLYYNNESYSSEDVCNQIQKVRESKTCPISALTLLAAVLAGFCWLFIIVLFIVKIVLNKPTYQKLDYIGHLVAGGVFFLACLLEVLFYLMVVFGDFPCTNSDNDSGYGPSCSIVSTNAFLETDLFVASILFLIVGVLSILAAIFEKNLTFGNSEGVQGQAYGGAVAPAPEGSVQQTQSHQTHYKNQPSSEDRVSQPNNNP